MLIIVLRDVFSVVCAVTGFCRPSWGVSLTVPRFVVAAVFSVLLRTRLTVAGELSILRTSPSTFGIAASGLTGR